MKGSAGWGEVGAQTLAWQPAANTFERKRKFTQRQDVAEPCSCVSACNCNRNEAAFCSSSTGSSRGQHGGVERPDTRLRAVLAVRLRLRLLDDYDWQAINFGLPKLYTGTSSTGTARFADCRGLTNQQKKKKKKERTTRYKKGSKIFRGLPRRHLAALFEHFIMPSTWLGSFFLLWPGR